MKIEVKTEDAPDIKPSFGASNLRLSAPVGHDQVGAPWS
jgi:hypothetical protein